ALGIDSGSALGIDSGSALGIDSGSALGIDSGSALGIDSGSMVLAGPVQSIDRATATFIAVGQMVISSGVGVSDLQVGDFVTVAGSISGAGVITATDVSVSSESYVAGATEVFVTGIPTAIDTRRGTAKIGELTVDYTPSMGRSAFDGIGAAISVIGTQPALGGTMLGDRVIDRTALFLGD
ncbi:MAG: hypothetical protein OEQ14_16910, partial [Gammaproteobacteria bacterium]|nr:hypothetical protein [Gammaproteobacteria bacterium]